MTRLETIIGVKDVEKSAAWYRHLLGCKGTHGGNTFEVLADQDNTVILCLHRWGDHGHPTLTNAQPISGNGLILYFRVTDLDKAWENALQLNATIAEPPHINQNSGKKEFSLWDIDGYFISISL